VKIKLDENLPVRLARALEKLGHDTDTIPEEDLAGRSDLQVWEAS
jgi:predicted nuclease of predicted toxin-antitoxin system